VVGLLLSKVPGYQYGCKDENFFADVKEMLQNFSQLAGVRNLPGKRGSAGLSGGLTSSRKYNTMVDMPMCKFDPVICEHSTR